MKKILSILLSVITAFSVTLTACAATNINKATTEVKTNVTKQINDNFVLINGGTFQMGSPTNEPEREADEVQRDL